MTGDSKPGSREIPERLPGKLCRLFSASPLPRSLGPQSVRLDWNKKATQSDQTLALHFVASAPFNRAAVRAQKPLHARPSWAVPCGYRQCCPSTCIQQGTGFPSNQMEGTEPSLGSHKWTPRWGKAATEGKNTGHEGTQRITPTSLIHLRPSSANFPRIRMRGP